MKTNLFEQTRRALERMNIRFETLADHQAFRFRCRSETSQWLTLVGCEQNGEVGLLWAASQLPMAEPPPKRAALARPLHHLNYRVHFGAFLLDDTDGQIIFRTSAWVADDDAPDFTLQQLVASNCYVVDTACGALAGFLFGKLTAEQTLRDICEPEQSEPPPAPAPPARRFPDRWQLN